MRHLIETLYERNQRPPSALLWPPHPTFTAAIHSSRSASEMDLHSRLTRGFAQEVAYAAVMNVRRRAKNAPFAMLAVILGGRW